MRKLKLSKLFCYDGVAKCYWILKRWIPYSVLQSYTGTNDGVWWGIFKEYLKQNVITAVLRKTNAHSVVICRLIKKINTVNKNRSKLWFKNWFKLLCLSGFISKKESFYTARGWNSR